MVVEGFKSSCLKDHNELEPWLELIAAQRCYTGPSTTFRRAACRSFFAGARVAGAWLAGRTRLVDAEARGGVRAQVVGAAAGAHCEGAEAVARRGVHARLETAGARGARGACRQAMHCA